MNGKENIISKILSDADIRCQEILAQANAQLQATLKTCDEQIDADKQALDTRIEAQSKERLKNRLATAELDARKYKLNAKQCLIAECYDKAYSKLKTLSDKEKTAFLSSLISNFAEKGETVLIAEADKGVVTQKFLDGFDKNLTLGKKCHGADGGIILEGKGYEKDLTLSMVISYLREQTESQVAAVLFGE